MYTSFIFSFSFFLSSSFFNLASFRKASCSNFSCFFSFLVNCFTVPENGKIFYSLHYCLFAVSMAGASGAQANMVYDLIKGENRQNALAFTLAICGVVGFVTTCLMSPVVDMIQKNGNQVLGIPMYAQQFVSGVACVMTLISIIYMKKNIIGKQEKEASEQIN